MNRKLMDNTASQNDFGAIERFEYPSKKNPWLFKTEFRTYLRKRGITRKSEGLHCFMDSLCRKPLILFFSMVTISIGIGIFTITLHFQKDGKQEERKSNKIIENNKYISGLDMSLRSLLIISILLGIVRWQSNNRQAAMSEMFERKRDTNLFIITHEKHTKELVSGATNQQDISIDVCFNCYDIDDCKKQLMETKKYNPQSRKQATFIQKMYVYLELDNLEFAFNKYHAGYLNDEEMYRACEIFDSRCRSPFFRHLAANQGLTYYTSKFQDLVCASLVFGLISTGQLKKNMKYPIVNIKNALFSYKPIDEDVWRIEIENFTLEKGTLLLVKGNNMTGKSTFLNIISGMLYNKNYHGDFIVNGIQVRDSRDIRNISTIISNSDSMFPELSIWENIKISIPTNKKIADEKKKCIEIIKNSGILKDEDIDKPLENFSTGTKSLVKLCRAYISSKEIAIIDELTSYLDDSRAYFFLDMIIDLLKKNTTVLLVSHSNRDRSYILQKAINLNIKIKNISIVRTGNISKLSYD